MKTVLDKTKSLATALALAAMLAGCGSGLPGGNPMTPQYSQIERLARPAVNEGLILTNSKLNLFNAVAPNVDLTPAASGVVTEALGTLTAVLKLGVNVFHALTGANIWQYTATVNGFPVNVGFAQGIVASSDSSISTAQYASLALSRGLQFLPDVMRISVKDSDISGLTSGNPDTTGTTNGQANGDAAVGYISCINTTTGIGASPTGPLLCGGRKIRDNTAAITLNYLALGASFITQIWTGYFDGATSCAGNLDPACTGTKYLVNDGYTYTNTHLGSQAWGKSGTDNNSFGFPYLSAPYSN